MFLDKKERAAFRTGIITLSVSHAIDVRTERKKIQNGTRRFSHSRCRAIRDSFHHGHSIKLRGDKAMKLLSPGLVVSALRRRNAERSDACAIVKRGRSASLTRANRPYSSFALYTGRSLRRNLLGLVRARAVGE